MVECHQAAAMPIGTPATSFYVEGVGINDAAGMGNFRAQDKR